MLREGERHGMHAHGKLGRLGRLAALIGVGSSLIVMAGCGGSSTIVTSAHGSATGTAARATASATTLPDPAQTPTTVALAPTPQGDPSQCSPASTVAPLPTTFATVYTFGADGTITALNASDGSKRWSYATGVNALPSFALGNGLVYASLGLQAAGSPTTIQALGAVDGAVKWQLQLPGDSHYGGGVPLQVVDGVVYVPGADGILRALDGATGAERWRYPVGGGIASLTVAGGSVYAQNYLTGGLVALRVSDGSVLWRFSTDANVEMAPTAANGLVYVAQTGTTLAALNATTGVVHWRDDFTTPYSQNGLGSAVAAGTGLYVNAFHTLFALNASTGALCWTAMSCGQLETSVPLLDGDLLYETCFGGSPGPGSPVFCSVHALDAHTGAERWTDGMHGFVHVTPASLVNGLLFVNATQAQALRPDTGAAAWRYPAKESQLAEVGLIVIGTVVYTALADGTVHALNAVDGTALWSVSFAASGTYSELVAGA
jgi:eukaryotic-like serine/threonine-protein kinase